MGRQIGEHAANRLHFIVGIMTDTRKDLLITTMGTKVTVVRAMRLRQRLDLHGLFRESEAKQHRNQEFPYPEVPNSRSKGCRETETRQKRPVE